MNNYPIPKPYVLIVDDIPANLLALEKVLRKLDLSIIRASSGNEALTLTLSYDFALIILDVQMPGMDGFEVAELLKYEEKTAYIPIIFVTAIDRETTKEMIGYDKGAVDFIFKPLNEHILRSKVKIFLEIYQMKTGLEHIVDERTHELIQANKILTLEIKKNIEAQEVISESEKRFRSLISNIHGAVYRSYLNKDLWITSFVSDNIKTMSGYPATDFIQNNIRTLNSIIHDDDKKHVFSTIFKNEEQNEPYELEYRILNANNQIRWVFEKGQVVVNKNHQISHIDGFIVDVTEVKEKEEQLRQTQKMDTIGTLAGGLAHDFNNVLGGIIGTLSLMRFKLGKDHDISKNALNKYLGTMEESGKRAKNMVHQLLTLSRKQEVSLAPTDINKIIKYVIKVCKSSLDKSVRIKTKFFDKTAMTYADSNQIEQVLLNICVNAAHAMTIMKEEKEKKGGSLSVSIKSFNADALFCNIHSGAKEQLYWVIAIKDTGVGIPQAVLKNIFNPFFTTKKQGEGTGLGLSMVYSIIQQHQGIITVSTPPEGGTCFEVYLPQIKVEETSEEQQIDKESEIAEGDGLVLIIDDEEIMLSIAQEILEACGYNVLLASTGKDGVRLFEENTDKIKIVLLDMAMPKMSGEEVYLALKEKKKDLKVLIASGFKQDQRVERIMQLGVNGYIQKPYTIEELAQTVNKIIHSK